MRSNRRGILPDYSIAQATDAKTAAQTDTSARTGGIDLLTVTASVSYTQSELQAVIDKLNELLKRLQAKSA